MTTTDTTTPDPSAQEMRETRARLGLTQAQLAAELGYSRRETITDMERGAQPVPARTMRALRMLLALSEPRRRKGGARP